MKPYADTNLFTRLYLQLPDTAEAIALAAAAREAVAEPLPIFWLHRVELANAFEMHVFFGRQPGHVRVTTEQAAAAVANFREDLAAGAFLRPARLSETLLEDEFTALSGQFTAKHGFRAYDILHVAAARLLGCDTFLSFDGRAAKLAKLAGLKTQPRPPA